MASENLLALSETFEVFFKRARNRARIIGNSRRMSRRIESRIMRPAAREMIDYMTEEIQGGLSHLKRGNMSEIRHMIDWKHIEEQAAMIIKPAMLTALVEGGKSIVERKLKKQERFDPIGEAAVNWATSNSANLVVEITKDQRKAIRQFIVQGLKAGKSIPKIMRELRPTVGILSRYMRKIVTLRIEMEAAGIPAAEIERKIDRLKRHYHHLRINTISRTETKNALWEGIFQGYGQMGISKVEGVSDSKACDWCQDNINGKIYTLEEARSIADSSHPNCECTWVAAA